jgi:Flp pilus assembly pilin Flp
LAPDDSHLIVSINLNKNDLNKKEASMLKNWKQFLKEEDGMGTVEIILIIVVLIGIVIIFKSQITELVENIFKRITSQSNKV